jgi:hypothetical protein
MPRNVEENVYVTIGFARESPTWQRLQREARDLDISVPHLIKVLLADRTAALEGHGKHLWFPRGMQERQKQLADSPSIATSSRTVEGSIHEREIAAAAAANYWDD